MDRVDPLSPEISTMPAARRLCALLLIAAALFCGAEQRSCAVETAQPAASHVPTPVIPPKATKKVEKIHIVGYALVVLMLGLGVLVVCHFRERKARPDLPKEMLEERLRQGMKAAPMKKS
jgi:hypothetical protein